MVQQCPFGFLFMCDNAERLILFYFIYFLVLFWYSDTGFCRCCAKCRGFIKCDPLLLLSSFVCGVEKSHVETYRDFVVH